MDIKNCKNCGRIYNCYGGNLLCPSCQRKLDEQFKVVKQYIYENKNATVEEVSNALDISKKQIYIWIREEKLSLQEEAISEITCERCGVSIKTGRFCEKCKAELCQSLSRNKNQSDDPDIKEKMYFLGRK